MLRIGILASTKGTDMQAVIDVISSKKLNAVISVVVSNKKDAYALERAKNNNINVNNIAAILGGGGHAKAAGCRINGTIADVKKLLLQEISKKIGIRG